MSVLLGEPGWRLPTKEEMESGRVIVAGVDDSPVGSENEGCSANVAGRRTAFAGVMVFTESRTETLPEPKVRTTSSFLEIQPTVVCCQTPRYAPGGGSCR